LLQGEAQAGNTCLAFSISEQPGQLPQFVVIGADEQAGEIIVPAC
jgi:hypothetical protein